MTCTWSPPNAAGSAGPAACHVPPLSAKTPATPRRAQLPPAIGVSLTPNDTASTPARPQACPGADAASAPRVVSDDQCPAVAAAAVGASSMLPSCSRASACPDAPTASASGTSARSASSRPGVQFRPASLLAASGEKARPWLGRNPTSSDVPPAPPAATSPPLSATPSGVTSDQRVAPVGRRKSCQKLLYEAADPPMTATAHVPCAVTSEVDNGAVTTVRLGALTGALCDAHPAARARPAPSRGRRASQARREITGRPAPGGRTG